MVSGAIILQKYGDGGDPIRYTVAAGVAVTKGDMWRLIDPVSASGANFAAVNPGVGIAAADKSASDGATSVAFFTNVRADIVASGAISIGAPVTLVAENMVRTATVIASGASIFGWPLETASDNERVAVRVRL